MKQGELLARISAQLRVKADATWVQSIVKGVLEDDSEAMNILQTILPEPIISRIQVKSKPWLSHGGGHSKPITGQMLCCRAVAGLLIEDVLLERPCA